MGRYRYYREFERGGVIPFYIDPETKHPILCLGVDAKHNAFTNFGGGIKRNETYLEGSVREFLEETHGAFRTDSFNPYTNEYVNGNSIIVESRANKQICFFVPIPRDVAVLAQSKFDEDGNYARHELENSGIVWMILEEFVALTYLNSSVGGMKGFDNFGKFFQDAITVRGFYAKFGVQPPDPDRPLFKREYT